MVQKDTKLVIITGMSGAGKTVAVQSFEDLGYFVVDNMLPNLIVRFLDIIEEDGDISKVALVMDLRSKGFYDLVVPTLDKLKNRPDTALQILFLEASDDDRKALTLYTFLKVYQLPLEFYYEVIFYKTLADVFSVAIT